MTKKYLLCVQGPTAIGKSNLAIKLAKHYNTHILSADSRQFFKEMRIGTAVPSASELRKVPHHFIHHKSILEAYSVGDFERDALGLLEELFAQKDVVLMVGGSGLYMDAVIRGLDDFPKVDPTIRENLKNRLRTTGISSLQGELKDLDPSYYAQVDLNNPHRLIRALEICIGTGKPFSSFLSKKSKIRFFSTVQIGLTAGRETIYERINQRVDSMMGEGLLEEVKSLYPYKERNALQTVGYSELFKHLEGFWALEVAVEEIKKNTRRFAKRQLTWLRKNKDIQWFEYDTPTDEIVQFLSRQMSKE